MGNPGGPVRRGLRMGIPTNGLLQRLGSVEVPVFVANGDSDPMILPHYSYLIAGLIPQARVKITQTLPTVSCFSITRSSPPMSTPSCPEPSVADRQTGLVKETGIPPLGQGSALPGERVGGSVEGHHPRCRSPHGRPLRRIGL